MNPDPAPPALRFYLLNAQGLSASKFPAILRWLREKSAHGAIITETHLSSDPASILNTTAGAGTIWPGMRLFHTPGTGHSEGVVLVLGPGFYMANPVQFVHPNISTGRILRVDLDFYDSPASIVAVYGPAQPDQRAAFYSQILPTFLPTSERPLLVAGDFNTVLSENDCWYRPGHAGLAGPNTRLIGSEQLSLLMDAHSLPDIWRSANPTVRDFTHFSSPAQSGARLDRFLANAPFRQRFGPAITSRILPVGGAVSDHRPVSLTFRAPPPAVPRGSGILSFPLAVLNIKEAVEEIEAAITTHSAAVISDPSPVNWSNFKAVIRDTSLGIYRKHRRRRQQAAEAAEAAAATAHSRLSANTDPAQHPALVALAKAASDAVLSAWRELLDPAELAGKILDHQFGDQSSYYFFHGARKHLLPTVIAKLNRPGRAPSDDPAPVDLGTPAGRDLALKYAMDYYASDSPSGLFSPRPVDLGKQDAVLATLKTQLPGHLQHLAEGVDADSLLCTEDFDYALSGRRRPAL